MKKILKKIFRKSRTETDNISAEFRKILDELGELIKKCKEEKDNTYKDIDQINIWAKEIILDVFEVPHRFWYEELTKYEEIKQLEENININSVLVKRCDNIIEGYVNQIRNREEKIKSCELMYAEYQKIKEKIKTQIKQTIVETKEDENIKDFNSNIKKYKKQNKESVYEDKILSPEEKLFRINNDIKALEDELRFMQEFENETKNINNRF